MAEQKKPEAVFWRDDDGFLINLDFDEENQIYYDQIGPGQSKPPPSVLSMLQKDPQLVWVKPSNPKK